LYGAEAALSKEIKHRSLQTATKAPPCPSEAEDKDLLEPDKLKAVANLQKCQDETKAWRDLKVKLQELDVGNPVLLRSPRTKSSDKVEAKRAGPYVVIEKSRPGAYCILDPQGKMLEHSSNAGNLHRFFV
jgi:hypothetical protein